MGELIEKYGYAPSARIYTVADADEAWLVQVVHGRNFVAARCPDDAVTVMPNLYTIYELDSFPAEDIIASKSQRPIRGHMDTVRTRRLSTPTTRGAFARRSAF